jgi:hypothetical protein
VSFLHVNIVHTPFWATCRKGCKSTSRNFFRKITWPSFFTCFQIPSRTFEVLHKAKNKHLVVCSPIHPFFLFDFKCFLPWMCISLGLPHPLAISLSHCIFGQPLDPMKIHLFCWVHGREMITSHNVIWNAFASIVRNASFHVMHEHTHFLLPPTLQSSH